MYKGKFGSRNPSAPSIPEGTAQPTDTSPESRSPVPNPPSPGKPRRHPRLGGTIFYTLYFFFIGLFCLCVFLGLRSLDRWLVTFEATHHSVRSQDIFRQYFGNPQWDQLYALCGMEDSVYEDGSHFDAYMDERVGGQALRLQETPDGNPHTRQYSVLLGSETIASFCMTDFNRAGEASLQNPDPLPNWQISSLELFLRRDRSFRITMPEGCRAAVNGVALEDSHTIQIAVPLAASYLPKGISAARTFTQEVTGLFSVPEVTVTDEKGTTLEVTYDSDTSTFTAVHAGIAKEEQEAVTLAAGVRALWLISQETDPEALAELFQGDAYEALLDADRRVPQELASFEFTDVILTDFLRLGDRAFHVRAGLTLRTVTKDGSAEDFPYSQSMLFVKQENGRWICTQCKDEDLSVPVGRVRLTFMLEDQKLVSEFYSNQARQIITPIINAPPGTVFSGWARQTLSEDGLPLLEPVFRPDRTGLAILPEDAVLTPMTLYAHFVPLNTP